MYFTGNLWNGEWRLYYGAADTFVGLASTLDTNTALDSAAEAAVVTTLRQFCARHPNPPHFSRQEWQEEMLSVAWVTAIEALQMFDERFGVPMPLFIRQRVWNALKAFWRTAWNYGVHTVPAPASEEGDTVPQDEPPPSELPTPESSVAADTYALRDLVAQLPERERHIIERHFWARRL
ncbi:hypothetical protein HRbin17_00451 [bacterium HR17]|uniref:Uncharacterized protein n=1 Tax=Candidatus Fervidibacter japonicus TaxID=2035412 RepID=A0A2H5X9U0_9BACT|nr:hypothetical protein HRbin17_00451 [bacterium HR17]